MAFDMYYKDNSLIHMFVENKQKVQHKATILCPICGLKFVPDSSNICQACTLASLDNESLLSASEEQLLCIYCKRYERPPWINCQRESAELLAILLKKIKGLGKMDIKEAKFVWTEPHSKRIRIKVDFIRVINQTTKIQQTEVVQFIEKYTQCHDCKKQFTPHEWNSLIQIRQHADHPRTLAALEQNLMRQKWIQKTLKVQTVEGGMDLHYKNQHDASGCLSYIRSHLPVSYKCSSQLISHNERDNTSNVKITHALVIPKICKDDLLLMHPRFCKTLGNCSPLLLCLKVTSQLYFLDPTCNRRLVITPSQFFALQPYSDIFTFKHKGVSFMVLDNEGVRNEQSNHTVATWGLVVTKPEQMKEQFIRSHLNLQVGQEALGYCLEDFCYIKNMPNYVLVKKVKTEEEIAKKRAKKDQKRKQQRNEKKKKMQQSKQVSQMGAEQKKEEKEQEQNEEQEQWVDQEDDLQF